MKQLVTICGGRRQGKSLLNLACQVFNTSWDQVTKEQIDFVKSQIEFTPVYHHMTSAIQATRDSQLSKSEKYLKWYGGNPQQLPMFKSDKNWNLVKIDFEKLEESVQRLLKGYDNE